MTDTIDNILSGVLTKINQMEQQYEIMCKEYKHYDVKYKSLLQLKQYVEDSLDIHQLARS